MFFFSPKRRTLTSSFLFTTQCNITGISVMQVYCTLGGDWNTVEAAQHELQPTQPKTFPLQAGITQLQSGLREMSCSPQQTDVPCQEPHHRHPHCPVVAPGRQAQNSPSRAREHEQREALSHLLLLLMFAAWQRTKAGIGTEAHQMVYTSQQRTSFP